ncbi:MAG: DNA-binding response regulator [Candidatus Paraimprobicoccus trichonymphae]|uniref:Stage 0 sporulation protein A homolog n=1 Tax=Candidatus Paraimprobicoccus trichonymphae TaxID=3033793 RepID=A0AA48I6F0_9FIRM|nr:MAG: DNA-binding response regulator [Candidatus Paraimprobicoccus trichonymphae]
MRKVLIVEDEVVIREFEVINLTRNGYTVVETDTGEKALEIFENESDIDIAVIDIMLPSMDGLTLCKKLRKLSDTLGIILLTAKTQEIDKISGLMYGADDYITKPFSPSELIARMDVLYRRVVLNLTRTENNFKEEIKFGEFVLNLRSKILKKFGKVISLSQVEFQIMEYFFSNPNFTLGRKQILKHVWGENNISEEKIKIIDVNIRRLRMKIEDNPSTPKNIVTVWGIGYKWII